MAGTTLTIESMERLTPEFLAKHPSPIGRVGRFARYDSESVGLFAELEGAYPYRMAVGGRFFSGWPLPELIGLGASRPADDHWSSCLISDGRAVVSTEPVGMIGGNLMYLPHNFTVVKECGK
jgi:hypothetical protein